MPIQCVGAKWQETLIGSVHSFVTSRLDMGNSLLFGLPQDQIARLQRIQNADARFVTLTGKSSHITSIPF